MVGFGEIETPEPPVKSSRLHLYWQYCVEETLDSQQTTINKRVSWNLAGTMVNDLRTNSSTVYVQVGALITEMVQTAELVDAISQSAYTTDLVNSIGCWRNNPWASWSSCKQCTGRIHSIWSPSTNSTISHSNCWSGFIMLWNGSVWTYTALSTCAVTE